MEGHVSGRTGLRETGAVLDREPVATTICSSHSKGKRDRDTNVVHSLKDRENLKKSLHGKLTRPSGGEIITRQKMYEADAEVEARNWEKRKF